MVGVVILNYNTPEDVLTCVDSVKKHTATDYKIYLVDNCSTDDSAKILSEAYGGDEKVVLIISDSNKGFSAGNNIGIKRAAADGCSYVCIMNADVILTNDVLSILESKLAADGTVAVAAPAIRSPNSDEECQIARNKLTLKNFLAEKTFLKRNKRYCKKHPRYQVKDKYFTEDYKFFGMTYGCCYMMPTEVLIRVKFFDEDVFLYCEEDILAYKLEKLSLYTLICPEAVIIHNHHSSTNKTPLANVLFHYRMSEILVLRKYDGVSRFKLFPIILAFKLSWLKKSLKSKEFASRKKAYFAALKKVKKIKRRCGLEDIV